MRPAGRMLVHVMLFGALALPIVAAAEATDAATTGACPACGDATGRGRGGGARMFDPKTVTTIRGEVLEIERRGGRRGHGGMHVVLSVGSEKIAVHLGPDFYVDAQPVTLAKGDAIEVKGSRIEGRAGPFMIAQEIRRGADVLRLRDSSGVPLWRGQGMRAR